MSKYTQPAQDRGCLYNMLQQKMNPLNFTKSFPLRTKFKHKERKLNLEMSSAKKIVREQKQQVQQYKKQLRKFQKIFKSNPPVQKQDKEKKKPPTYRIMSSESIPQFAISKSNFYDQIQNRKHMKNQLQMRKHTNYSMKAHRKISKSLVQKSMPLVMKILPSQTNFCITQVKNIDQLIYTYRVPKKTNYLRQNKNKIKPSIRKKKQNVKTNINMLEIQNEKIKGWQIHQDNTIIE